MTSQVVSFVKIVGLRYSPAECPNETDPDGLLTDGSLQLSDLGLLDAGVTITLKSAPGVLLLHFLSLSDEVRMQFVLKGGSGKGLARLDFMHDLLLELFGDSAQNINTANKITSKEKPL